MSASAETAGWFAQAAAEIVLALAEGRFHDVLPHLEPGAHAGARAMIEALASSWGMRTQGAGSFVRIASIERQPSHAGQNVHCLFENGTVDVQLDWAGEGKLRALTLPPSSAGFWQPPRYAVRQSFQELALAAGCPPVRLPGVLAFPKRDRPVAAVVLVHGSGPHDQDETIGMAKPFKDLAWGLASRGIAVYRFAKRSSLPGFAGLCRTVWDETIDDACSAVERLRSVPAVDSSRIFVLGHSLGGMLVPRIMAAVGPENIAGGVILAGNSRPLESVLLSQISDRARATSPPSARDGRMERRVRRFADRVRDPGLRPGDRIRVLGEVTCGSYWLDLRSYDPARVASLLPNRLMVLHGGADRQVTQEDFEGWRDGIPECSRVTFKLYPHLNHLMMKDAPAPGWETTGPDSGHISQDVIDDIGSWIPGGPSTGPRLMSQVNS